MVTQTMSSTAPTTLEMKVILDTALAMRRSLTTITMMTELIERRH